MNISPLLSNLFSVWYKGKGPQLARGVVILRSGRKCCMLDVEPCLVWLKLIVSEVPPPCLATE